MADSSFAKILSGVVRPTIPANLPKEIDKYARDLDDYLRRLTGKFTSFFMLVDPTLRYEDMNGHIRTVEAMSYCLVEYAPFAFSLDWLRHKTTVGGCTIAVQVNGVTVSGTGDATPSTTQGEYVFALNVVNVGDRVTILVSGLSSSPENLTFTLRRTRLVE